MAILVKNWLEDQLNRLQLFYEESVKAVKLST